MFVRTITEDGERTYDCKKYLWQPQKIEDDPTLTHATVVIDVGEQDERVLIMTCVRGSEFIVMNNAGKTIDRKVW